jgi:hypothetical protein
MFNTTHKDREEIRSDWLNALHSDMLHEEYGELRGKELIAHRRRDPEFLKRFSQDCKEFLTTITTYRRIQAEKLYAHDPVYFSYLKDKKQYIDFAKFGGTECRLIYRTFFAQKGYDSFKGWLNDRCLDGPALEFIREIYADVDNTSTKVAA